MRAGGDLRSPCCAKPALFRHALGLLLAVAASCAAPLIAQPLPVGPEIPAQAPGAIANPGSSVAIGPDGGFVALWTEDAAGPFRSGLVRAFSPAGQPLRSAPDAVNPGTLSEEEAAGTSRIAALGPGRYVAVWTSAGGGAAGSVIGQLLDASGAPVGEIFLIGDSGSSGGVVDGLPSGGFVVAWRSASGGIVVRRFDAEAHPQGPSFQLVDLQGSEPSVAAFPNGGYVVAWHRLTTASTLNGVFYRIFAPNDQPVTPPTRTHGASTAARTRARVTASATGIFVVTWAEGLPFTAQEWRIVARRFAMDDGEALGPELTVRTVPAGTYFRNDDVAQRPADGAFLALWTEDAARARIFSVNENPMGEAFRVHDAPGGFDYFGGEVAADADGWVVSWSTSAGQVRLRRIQATCRIGEIALCLNGWRYSIAATWHVPGGPQGGDRGIGHPVSLSDDTGAFWFFGPDNVELVVKVLDGGGINGKVWVFYGSLTDVEFDLVVTDQLTGESRTYHNPGGRMASHADTAAFPASPRFPEPVPPIQPLFTPRPLAAGPQIPLQEPRALPGDQPWVAVGEGGGFAAVWEALEEPAPFQVRGFVLERVFLPSGRPAGPADRVSAPAPAKVVLWPRIAPLVSGDWMTLWVNALVAFPSSSSSLWKASVGEDGSLSGRFLDPSGQPDGAEILLAPNAFNRPATAPHPAGGALVAWSEGVSGPVKIRRFVDGAPAGPEIVVASEGSNPALATLADGRFVVVWESRDFSVPGSGLRVRVYQADGAPAGAGGSVSSPAQLTPFDLHTEASVAVGPGGIVVAWTYRSPNRSQILVRRLTVNGQPLGDRVEVQAAPENGSVQNPSVAVRLDGSFLVLWSQQEPRAGGGGTSETALARLYRADGTPAGASFRVHDDVRTVQHAGNAAAAEDGWLVSWEQPGGAAPALFARQLTLPCEDRGPGLCLHGGRFRAEASWRVPGTGARGTASPVVLTGDTGTFWFFTADNTELIVKVLDGRGVNGKYWVFYGALTDVEFDLTVTDTVTGQQRTYHNPAGSMASRSDTEAF